MNGIGEEAGAALQGGEDGGKVTASNYFAGASSGSLVRSYERSNNNEQQKPRLQAFLRHWAWRADAN